VSSFGRVPSRRTVAACRRERPESGRRRFLGCSMLAVHLQSGAGAGPWQRRSYSTVWPPTTRGASWRQPFPAGPFSCVSAPGTSISGCTVSRVRSRSYGTMGIWARQSRVDSETGCRLRNSPTFCHDECAGDKKVVGPWARRDGPAVSALRALRVGFSQTLRSGPRRRAGAGKRRWRCRPPRS
jgi:hypothetical protein